MDVVTSSWDSNVRIDINREYSIMVIFDLLWDHNVSERGYLECYRVQVSRYEDPNTIPFNTFEIKFHKVL